MSDQNQATVTTQLVKLQDALLEGRISQEIYERLKADLLTAAGESLTRPPNEDPADLPPPIPQRTKQSSSTAPDDLEADLAEAGRFLTQGKEASEYAKGVWKKRMNAWQHAADSGNSIGQWLIAMCYDNGFGVQRDMAKGAEWHRKAAEQGNAFACLTLGACYENGEGVSKDLSNAINWYRKSAELGNPFAQTYLGMCYFEGKGVPEDIATATEWFRKAADQGERNACCALGMCYHQGTGVGQDSDEAVKYLRKAAEQGDRDAVELLGQLLPGEKSGPVNADGAQLPQPQPAQHGASQTSPAAMPRTTMPVQRLGVTPEGFNAIQDGMTRQNVEAILGCTSSSSGLVGNGSEMHTYGEGGLKDLGRMLVSIATWSVVKPRAFLIRVQYTNGLVVYKDWHNV